MARRVVDAQGKVVCPGFVDAHSHSDWSLFANPTAQSTIARASPPRSSAIAARVSRASPSWRAPI
ncbi:MAG TPA: amidohydrolase family protein [Chloroflexota bacterium]